MMSFSSLYIGILAATVLFGIKYDITIAFQFPLHRDPRCNGETTGKQQMKFLFQFPLHRDPRCNITVYPWSVTELTFQFPLHRDPRCNLPRWSRD